MMQEGFVNLPVRGKIDDNGDSKELRYFYTGMIIVNVNNIAYVSKSDIKTNCIDLHLNNGDTLIVEKQYVQAFLDVKKLFEK